MKIIAQIPTSLIFIICFMPLYIQSIEQIAKILTKVCNPLGTFRDSILEKKNPYFHQIECVLEYILESRIVQTELHAEHFFLGKWLIFRRIASNDEINQLKIHENKMFNYNFEKFENKDEANKKTEECFSMNEKVLDRDGEGKFLSMEKLFNLTNNQIVLPNEWGTKLDSLQKCMLRFLRNSKFYNFDSIKPIFLDDLKGKTDEEKSILKSYKLKYDPNVVLQWKWVAEKPKQEETIYEEGEDGFEELKKCEQFELVIKKENGILPIDKSGPSSSSTHLEAHHHDAKILKMKGKMVAHEKEKIDVMEMLKYFNEEQLFFEEHYVFYFDEKKEYIKMDEKHCPICLQNFEQNEKLEGLYCGHYFHWKCIQESRKNKNTCPICRKKLNAEAPRAQLTDEEMAIHLNHLNFGYGGV